MRHLPPRYLRGLRSIAGIGILPPTFTGRLYVLQSGDTFSSAMYMDDVLAGPGLGLRVGAPVGEATGGWGGVHAERTPVNRVAFQVSSAYATPPRGPVRPTLLPDIPLPLTVKDIQQGVDPVADWLATLGSGAAAH